jgi:hypothetical protein
MQRGQKNMKIDLQKVGGGGTELSCFAQEKGRWWAIVKALMNIQMKWRKILDLLKTGQILQE